MTQTLTWSNTGTGDWNTTTNWAPESVPASGDTAIISSGTAQLISGVNPANGVTLDLGGAIVNQTILPAVLETQGTNVVFGNSFVIQDSVVGAGALETSGSTTFDGTLLVSGGTSVDFALTVDNDGTVPGVFDNAGVISVSGGAVIAILNTAGEATTIPFDTGVIDLNHGNLAVLGSVELESGGVISMSNTSAAILTHATSLTDIAMADGSETLEIAEAPNLLSNYAMGADISGMRPGDEIILQGATIGSLSYSETNQILTVLDTGGSEIASLNVIGTYAADAFAFTNNSTASDATIDLPPCFAGGTCIATARGDVAVEMLHVGDRVVTVAGEAQPIVWLGHRRVDCRRHPRPELVWPVRVEAKAFAAGVPARELWLSPDHAVYAEGVLIPIKHLINGTTIAQVPRDHVTYWHVELPKHAVILAEGLAAESYLDTGNRAQFEGGAAHMTLHPDFAALTWNDACVPLAIDGPEVVATRKRLLARVGELGYRRAVASAVYLRVDGRAVRAAAIKGKLHRFMLPAGCEEVRVVSASGVPAGFDLANADCRRLGARIGAVFLDGEFIALDSPALAAGFHPLERNRAEQWRWTDGDGRLVLAQASPRPVTLELLVRDTMPHWQQPASGRAEAA